jgi:hypothetical protein
VTETEDERPRTEHRPFGSDRVEAAPDGGVWLICGESTGWTPRRGRAHTPGEFPGTAVRWETEIFEVVEALAGADGTQRYRLEPWPDRHAIREVQAYDATSRQRRSLERSGYRKSVAKRRLAILFAPILGHLPAPVQFRMESEFGAPAFGMTVASALPLFALGLVSWLYSMALAYGAGLFPGGNGPDQGGASIPSIPALLPLPLALYLVVENGFRLGLAFLRKEPVGSLPGALVYAIVDAFRGNRSLSSPTFRGLPASPDQALRDRYRMLEALLGLLTPVEQEGLARRFGFEPLRWGRRTAIVLLVVGGANVLASLIAFAAGKGALGDFLWLVAGAALTAEQIGRLRRIAQGKPAGSMFGALVRPTAETLLGPRRRARS